VFGRAPLLCGAIDGIYRPSRDSGCKFGAFMVRLEERTEGKGGAYQYSSADRLYCEEWAANESSSAADASPPTLASHQRPTEESRVCRCRRLALAKKRKMTRR
jgi:hypothetical protein